MKRIVLDLPDHIAERLRGDWDFSLGHGVRLPAALKDAEKRIRAALDDDESGWARCRSSLNGGCTQCHDQYGRHIGHRAAPIDCGPLLKKAVRDAPYGGMA